MESTESFVPYTYLLEWEDGTKYYGVRYAKTCRPSDLLVTYFSSSKYVHQKIQTSGMPAARIHRTFPQNRDAAIAFENRVLRILKCPDRASYLNKTYNVAIPPGRSNSKGKTYEQRYGIEVAKRLRQQRSVSNSLRRGSVCWAQEARDRVSLKRRGGSNGNAKPVTIVVGGNLLSFETHLEAGKHLNTMTSVKVATCVDAIHRKQKGQTTNRQAFKSLYESFDVVE